MLTDPLYVDSCAQTHAIAVGTSAEHALGRGSPLQIQLILLEASFLLAVMVATMQSQYQQSLPQHIFKYLENLFF